MKRVFVTLAILVMAFGNVGMAQQRINLKSMGKASMFEYYGLRDRSDIVPQTAYFEDTYGEKYRVIYEYDEYDYYLTTEVYEVYWDGVWQAYEMLCYEYGFSGDVIEMLVKDFDGEDWMDMARATYSYEDDLVSEIVIQYMEDGNWVNDEKAVYNYSGDVYTILYWTWNGNNWSSNELYTYTRTDDTIELIIQYMQGGAWQNDERAVFTLNFDEKVEEILDQSWAGTTWENSELTSYNYEGSVFTTKTIKQWEGSAWVDNLLFTYEYDENGNAKHGECSAFDGGNWETADGDIEMVFDNGEKSNEYYGYLADVEYVDLTAVKENAQVFSFLVYPVPAQDEIYIEAEGLQKAEIYSLTGQKVMESLCDKMNVSALSSGLYVMKVYDRQGGCATQRFVVK